MKKVFIVFLVFAYMNSYMGCAPTPTKITRKTYDEFDKSNIDESIIVMTKDSTEYYFEPLYYRFINVRIIGTAKIIDQSEEKTVNLARSEILSIGTLEVEYQPPTMIELLVGSLAAIGATIGLVYLIFKKKSEKG